MNEPRKIFFLNLLWILALNLLSFNATAHSHFQLKENIQGKYFFEKFDFFSEDDPVRGYVNYLGMNEARKQGLAVAYGEKFRMKVDSANKIISKGRDSVRIQSKKFYKDGLFVLDVSHVPSAYATWPTFWTNGRPPWPSTGEIDIFNGSHKMTKVHAVLHSSKGCDMSYVSPDFDGEWVAGARNCDAQVNNNAGCGIESNQDINGDALNLMKGGVFVMQKDTRRFIRMWFFHHEEVPFDLQIGSPTPEKWFKKPYALFPFGQHCSGKLFQDQRVIFQTTFCGEWAGETFPKSIHPEGKNFASIREACEDFVRRYPNAFQEAYWEINYLKIYEALDETVNPSLNRGGGYRSKGRFRGQSILSQFQFYTGEELSHGYVEYVNQQVATNLGILKATHDKLILRVETSPNIGPLGRKTVRLETINYYQDGLYVFDFDHIPEGCATWPSLWSLGKGTWPDGGHIEILAGSNDLTKAITSLRTKSECRMDGYDELEFDGTWLNSEMNCFYRANNYAGCGIESKKPSLGSHLNRHGGALVAMELDRASHVKIWIFYRNEVPMDIMNSKPNPLSWKTKPIAFFKFGPNCNGYELFSEQKFVLQTNLCGDWAGNTFPSTCSSQVGITDENAMKICRTYVEKFPHSFQDAYWGLNYIEFFSRAGGRTNPISSLISLPTSPSQVFYYLKEDLRGQSFLDSFHFSTNADPNNGFVKFVNRDDAWREGLIQVIGEKLKIGIETTQVTENKRKSVRLEGKTYYDNGLFVLDLNHMPEGCAVWPSLIMIGESPWPTNGEIDFITGVNDQVKVQTVLHTSIGCNMKGATSNFDGRWLERDCVFTPENKKGCSIEANDSTSFGVPFNMKSGGLFVIEFDRSSHIKVWHFGINESPRDLQENKPNPSLWKKSPYAVFPLNTSECNGLAKFGKQKFILQTNLCGDWAGWEFKEKCRARHGFESSLLNNLESCKEFAKSKGADFHNAYWSINSFKTFSRDFSFNPNSRESSS